MLNGTSFRGRVEVERLRLVSEFDFEEWGGEVCGRFPLLSLDCEGLRSWRGGLGSVARDFRKEREAFREEREEVFFLESEGGVVMGSSRMGDSGATE